MLFGTSDIRIGLNNNTGSGEILRQKEAAVWNRVGAVHTVASLYFVLISLLAHKDE